MLRVMVVPILVGKGLDLAIDYVLFRALRPLAPVGATPALWRNDVCTRRDLLVASLGGEPNTRIEVWEFPK